MSHYISDELYNQLINSDLSSSLKTQLIDSQKIILPIKKGSIVVRTLSNLEYDKYIYNGTADGSIIKYNVDVWHHIDKLNSNYSYEHPYRSGAHSQTIDTWLTILQNNTDNKYLLNKEDQTITLAHSYSSLRRSENHQIISMILDKNTDINQVTYTLSDGFSASWVYTMQYIFNYNCCFRPVFNFVDNNKSKNVYY